MSSLETYHAGGLPWREAIDQKAPRMVIRSNMQPVDHSYGIVDICRISEDADHGYETGDSTLADTGTTEQTKFTGLLTESVTGAANRFFYNGRVFWNDCDGFHIYKYNAPDRPELQLSARPRWTPISTPSPATRFSFPKPSTCRIPPTGLSC